MFGNTKTIVSIDLKGVIASGARAQLNNDALSSIFLKLEKIKCDAISININSPGGSPVQSSLIGNKIRSIASKKKVKVYAFVEDVAASGGYWLACSADKIYADDNSILGSIGVISGGFGFTGLIKKLGIERRIFTAGQNKSFLDPFSPVNKIDLEKLKKIRQERDDVLCQNALDALGTEQQNRLAAATERLKQVLGAGDPGRMEGVIVKLAREGLIDEPFLLLLEVNANQASAAGATGPAELMMRLKKKAAEEKDRKTTSKEVKLLRQLLREESSGERQKLLEDAFTPRENILVCVYYV